MLNIFCALLAGISLPLGATLLIDGERLPGQLVLGFFVINLIIALS